MMKYGIGYISILIVFMLCVFALSGCGGTQQTTSQQGTPGANNTGNQSSLQLTLAPNPTSTPVLSATSTTATEATATITNAGGAAILGASLDAFIAKYGQPNNHSTDGEPHFKGCNNSNIDQLILSQVSLESNAGPITSITAQACTPWTTSFAATYCSSFLPSDAKYERSVENPGSSSQLASIDKIYYSAELTQEFAAEDFTDGNGNGVQPGLFDVNYLYTSNTDTSHVGSCQLQLGTQ